MSATTIFAIIGVILVYLIRWYEKRAANRPNLQEPSVDQGIDEELRDCLPIVLEKYATKEKKILPETHLPLGSQNLAFLQTYSSVTFPGEGFHSFRGSKDPLGVCIPPELRPVSCILLGDIVCCVLNPESNPSRTDRAHIPRTVFEHAPIACKKHRTHRKIAQNTQNKRSVSVSFRVFRGFFFSGRRSRFREVFAV